VWVFKRGASPSFFNLPLPLDKGKGIKGIGSPNKTLIKHLGGWGELVAKQHLYGYTDNAASQSDDKTNRKMKEQGE